MPRTPRQSHPGQVVHLISRFVDRNWYISGDDERARYLQLLQCALRESDWRCLAYAVMNNHIHHGVIAGKQPLGSWVRRAHSPFADWLNRTHDRIGNIFVRGPKEIYTPPEHVGAMIAYIHNNPVRAGVVTQPGSSDWTSHRAYLGYVARPDWLHVDEGLARAGFANAVAFDDWVRTRPNERDVVRAIELADEEVVKDGFPPAVSAAELVALTAREIGLPLAQLRSRRRTIMETLGRRVAVHAAARLGIRCTEVAAALDLSPQAVSRIGRDPLDAALDRLVAAVLVHVPEPGWSVGQLST